jgi:hypothetical protein
MGKMFWVKKIRVILIKLEIKQKHLLIIKVEDLKKKIVRRVKRQ